MQDQLKPSVFQNAIHESSSGSRSMRIVVDIMSSDEATRRHQFSPSQKIMTRIQIIMRRINKHQPNRCLPFAVIVATEHAM